MSALDDVKIWLSEPLPAITAAQDSAKEKLRLFGTTQKLEPDAGLPDNVAIVAYGSLAREEWTQGSDVDWTLLIDGPVDAALFQIALEIKDRLAQLGYPPPGATGTFGSMASSHELVHRIGGIEDTNRNLTRRILLLLESTSINEGANDVVRSRVLRQLLLRYISLDPSLSWLSKPRWRVPRFLLNDVVRFWRTMAVDYASKKWEDPEGKWALRNAKLRFSRKLLFAKGLLLCFECDRGVLSPLPESYSDGNELASHMIERCSHYANATAVEVLGTAARAFNNAETARLLFLSYDRFIALLNDEDARTSLEKLRFEEANTNEYFVEIREQSKQFQKGLESLFFDQSSPWSELIQSHGVF